MCSAPQYYLQPCVMGNQKLMSSCVFIFSSLSRRYIHTYTVNIFDKREKLAPNRTRSKNRYHCPSHTSYKVSMSMFTLVPSCGSLFST